MFDPELLGFDLECLLSDLTILGFALDFCHNRFTPNHFEQLHGASFSNYAILTYV